MGSLLVLAWCHHWAATRGGLPEDVRGRHLHREQAATLVLGDMARVQGSAAATGPSPARGSVAANWAQRQPSQNFWGSAACLSLHQPVRRCCPTLLAASGRHVLGRSLCMKLRDLLHVALRGLAPPSRVMQLGESCMPICGGARACLQGRACVS